jgi:hypothetical protein
MKMKKYLFKAQFLLFIGFYQLGLAQMNMGVGTTSPDNSAVLEVFSKSGGFLTPRMSKKEIQGIEKPAQGLLVFQTDVNSGFYFYNNGKWNALSNTEALSIAAANPDNWSITGNSGLNHATNFIGNNDRTPISFMIRGNKAGLIDLTAGITASNSSYVGLGGLFIGEFAGNVNSGYHNVGLGVNALKSNTSGSSNMAIGSNVLGFNTTGYANTAIGVNALKNNTTGYHNIAIGEFALSGNVTGYANTGIGVHAGNSLNGNSNRNVFIGHYAGDQLVTGSSNVLIGYNAGATETNISNKLYISNSNTVNPLIKGDFAANNLKVNSKTTGYLAIGDFDTATSGTAGTGGLPLPANIGAVGGYRLVVQDGILCEKVKVALRATGSSDWADYVFEPEYKSKMMSLEDIEAFTIKNKHLPNVPSTEEVQKNGLDMQETSRMFMEKIEELTLYMIEMNKEIKALKEENEKLKK